MLFNSYSFIFFFLPFTVLTYYVFWLKYGISKAKYIILFSSIIFYTIGAKKFIILLLFSILYNYIIGKQIVDNKQHSKFYLILGVSCNLLILIYYKYFNFIVQNFNLISNLNCEITHINLPLGISFFTFTQIAFLVDIYVVRNNKSYSFFDHALLVSFYPHLIAGPLLHHSKFIPQWSQISLPISYEKVYKGLLYFIIGLCKKTLLADPIGFYANEVFTCGANSCLDAWLGSIYFSLQLYLDFSGYSDMAVGLAFLLQINIPQNFNAPYKAINIQDFWSRWHISLSDFLKYYLYIPLGGNRFGSTKTVFNILTTFILGGLWHGANWTFVVWGALHALGVIFYRFYKRLNISLPTSISWFFTMIFINFCWVFFKSDTINQALNLIHQMINFSDILNSEISVKFFDTSSMLTVAFYGIFIFFSTEKLYEKIAHKICLEFIAGIVLSAALFSMRRETIFLYFNF